MSVAHEVDSGRKDDHGKARTDLLQVVALTEVAKVCGFGAAKYGEDNWRLLKGWRRRYIAACLRHTFAHIAGGGLLGGLPRDPDSGLPHIAHAAWNLLSVLELATLGAP